MSWFQSNDSRPNEILLGTDVLSCPTFQVSVGQRQHICLPIRQSTHTIGSACVQKQLKRQRQWKRIHCICFRIIAKTFERKHITQLFETYYLSDHTSDVSHLAMAASVLLQLSEVNTPCHFALYLLYSPW